VATTRLRAERFATPRGTVLSEFIEETVMSDHTYKLVEIVGSSSEGTDAAIRNAIETASKSIRHIDWFEVVETRGHIVDGKVGHFQVTLKIGFRLESE
jgi:hypothetical protein